MQQSAPLRVAGPLAGRVFPSNPLEIMPSRIRDRHRNRSNRHRPRLLNCPCRRLHGRPRRNHIIHQRDAFALYRFPIHQPKRQPQIRRPIRRRINACLRRSIFQPHDRILHRNSRAPSSQPPRQRIRLIVPPSNLPRPVQRHRHENINLIQRPPNPRLLPHRIRQNLRHRPPMPIFHLMHHLPQWLPKRPQRHDRLKRRHSSPITKRTSTPLRHWRPTKPARRRCSQPQNRRFAFRTKPLPILPNRHPAYRATRRINKIRKIARNTRQHSSILS